MKMLFVQRLVQQKELTIDAVHTTKNVSDVGAKHHNRERLEFLRRKKKKPKR